MYPRDSLTLLSLTGLAPDGKIKHCRERSFILHVLPRRSEVQRSCAEVAELADALHSGCSARQGVEVRVLSSAPSSRTRGKVFTAI